MRTVRVPLAPIALAVVDLGGAIPYGLHDISHRGANVAEITLSVLFAVAALAALGGAFRWPRHLDEIAFASGTLWAIAAAYAAMLPDATSEARGGLGLTFAGIAVGCWAWWQALRGNLS